MGRLILLTEHEIKNYRRVCTVIVIALIAWKFFSMDFLTAIGLAFAVVYGADVVLTIVGHFVARLVFSEVYPKSIKELKHTSKQYQYILKFGDREIYSYVYTKPLSDVRIRCWKYLGSYLVEVTSKKKG